MTLLFLLLFVGFTFDSVAQKKGKKGKKAKKEKTKKSGKKDKKGNKKEMATWRKRLKSLTPEQYKNLIDENRVLKSQISGLEDTVGSHGDQLSSKDGEIAQCNTKVQELNRSLASARASGGSAKGVADTKGIIFKVQIGAFRNKDLSKYLNVSENFSGEKEGDLKKYTLGVFRDYWEADKFKKYLIEMGVKDAWIVSYRDGKRVPVKSVVENAAN